MASTSSGGKFYQTHEQLIKSTSVTINSGSTATFYYKDSSTGTPTLTASNVDFAKAQTTFNINTRCTGFDGDNWLYGWTVGTQPPWYLGVGVGYDGTNCAMSDSTNYLGGNDGPFTANSLDTSSANTITITFQYKLQNTNNQNDFRIAYSTATNPNLSPSSSDFTYFASLGTTGNDGTWHTYTMTFTKGSNPGLFTSHFWFRFESNLATHNPGGAAEYTYVDNVIISVT